MPNNQLNGLYTLEQFKKFAAIVEKHNMFDEECAEANLSRIESGWQYMATFRDDCNYKIPFPLWFNYPEAATISWSEPRWNEDEPDSPDMFRNMMEDAISEFEDVPGEETDPFKGWMRRINVEEAARLFLFNEIEVYRLYDDGTEGLIEDLVGLIDHYNRGGEFGVEQDEEHQWLVQFRTRVAATSYEGAVEEAKHKIECGEYDVTVDDEGPSDNE
ncbi:MAG TPA: hypothetical protein VFH42_00255 [Sporolactobacillaceae bacterium]|nr:hypothetical protein [Sporolactobacillaceae bacterium]